MLNTSLDLDDIVAQSRNNLRKIFKTGSVEFMLGDGAIAEEEVPSGFRTLVRPIMFQGERIGLLKLGPKLSGDSYTKQDLQLISTFVFQAAVAIQKAELYAQVRDYGEHLQSLVDERTHEIKRLQEDQKQTMIDISHNLQTPLAIIRGELEMLAETTKELDKTENVRKSLDRVSGFIRQLLHLARLEHSLYTVERTVLDLSELVREQADYFEVMAEEEGVRIETVIESGCRIEGNKRLLGELFVNLVTNAMTYRAADRAPEIRIGLSCDRTNVTVTVADNGIGIPEKDLPEIFQRFYRVAQPAQSLQGTGLGLAIVKNIVERHEGTIRVESELGAGTTFFIQFPCAFKRSSR